MKVLPTTWRHKPAGIDLKRTYMYVAVTLCITSRRSSERSQRISVTWLDENYSSNTVHRLHANAISIFIARMPDGRKSAENAKSRCTSNSYFDLF